MKYEINLKDLEKCCYCERPATGRDHLPPKNIFPNPRPTNLITVPTCKKCNQSASKDDEYFGYIIIAGSVQHPLAEQLFRTKKMDKIRRRPALGYSLLKDFVDIDVYKGNIYLGTQPGMRSRGKRINPVMERVTKGFIFHHLKYRLPVNYNVMVSKVNPPLSKTQTDSIASLELHSIGEEILSYRFYQDDNDPFISYWFFMFYNSLLIMTTTDPEIGSGI